MNPLQTLIHIHNLCPVEVMNLLQSEGKVSDNCVFPEDVADPDIDGAVRFLRGLDRIAKDNLRARE